MNNHKLTSTLKANDILRKASGLGMTNPSVKTGLNDEPILIWTKGCKKATVIVQSYIHLNVTFKNGGSVKTHDFEDSNDLVEELLNFLN